MPSESDARRAPVRAHRGHDREHPVDDRIGGQQHRELALVLRAAALRRDDHVDLVAGDELHVRRRRACCRRCSCACRPGRRASRRAAGCPCRCRRGARPRSTICCERHLRVPAHVHADADEGDGDARVLADRAVALGGHARVDEDLRHRVLRRGRLLALVGGPRGRGCSRRGGSS